MQSTQRIIFLQNKNTMKRTIFTAMAALCLLSVSCTDINIDIDLPDEPETPEAPKLPEFYYKVGDTYHEILAAAIYHEEDSGYNLVFSESASGLCSGYDRLNDRSVGLFSVDFPETLLGKNCVVGVDALSTEAWSFFAKEWDASSFVGTAISDPSEGEFEFSVDGSALKAEMTMVSEAGIEYEIHYDGPVLFAEDYVWGGFFYGGSFTVDGKSVLSSSANMYYDVDNAGYNLSVTTSEGEQFVIDFPEVMIGERYDFGSDTEARWSLKATAVIDGAKTSYSDYSGDFSSGSFACRVVDKDKCLVDVDMDIITSDRHELELHYHGLYSEGQHYQKKPVR